MGNRDGSSLQFSLPHRRPLRQQFGCILMRLWGQHLLEKPTGFPEKLIGQLTEKLFVALQPSQEFSLVHHFRCIRCFLNWLSLRLALRSMR
jgi:hypothetical protein